MPERILFVDVETTGLHCEDRVVSLGVILAETRHMPEQIAVKHTHCVFNPERACHPKASAVHGYDDWVLSRQQRFADKLADLLPLFESADLVVAHNAPFDMRFLRREFALAGVAMPERSVFCTMAGWRAQGLLGSAGLESVAAHFGHFRENKRHGALEDAWLAQAIYFGLHTPIRIPRFESLVTDPGPKNLRPVPARPRGWRLSVPAPTDPAAAATDAIATPKRRTGPRLSAEALNQEVQNASNVLVWDALGVVQELQRHGRLEDALRLGLELIDRVEADPENQRHGVPPAHYEQVAIILRKLGRRDDEVAILERYLRQKLPHYGAHPKMLERLGKLSEAASAFSKSPFDGHLIPRAAPPAQWRSRSPSAAIRSGISGQAKDRPRCKDAATMSCRLAMMICASSTVDATLSGLRR
nr:3'-5' exonuclease [Roseococcus sp. MDT2-1-1]